MECVDETSNETDASSQREKDSDDETRNDKTSIQRLIKEVEKLVGEERRTGVSKTFPPLILDDKKGITNNHRAKYARIKEWLKLNSVRGHDGRSTSQVGSNYYYCCVWYLVTRCLLRRLRFLTLLRFCRIAEDLKIEHLITLLGRLIISVFNKFCLCKWTWDMNPWAKKLQWLSVKLGPLSIVF